MLYLGLGLFAVCVIALDQVVKMCIRDSHGSIVIVSPSLNLRMCNWQVVMLPTGP